MASKPSSAGKHGGGHKDRDRGANASDRRAAARRTQANVAQRRGGRTDGRRGSPSGR